MSVSLRNHFLIAMPGMEDPNFAHSITYLCEHSDEGAMGLVVNRPLELCYDEIFDHLDIADFPRGNENRVLAGGPVKTDRGFVLHRNCDRAKPSPTINKIKAISLLLEAFSAEDKPINRGNMQ